MKDVNSINKWSSKTCKYQSKTNKIEMVSKHFFRKILRFMILKISVFEVVVAIVVLLDFVTGSFKMQLLL